MMKTMRVIMTYCLLLACLTAFSAFAADSKAERRDPFTPLVNPPAPDGGQKTPLKPVAANPLAAYTLGELRVVGIVLGELGNHAMLLAPDGNTYLIRVGAVIGQFNGVVSDISANVVMVKEMKEYQQDREIVQKEEETELKLNPLAQDAAAKPGFIVLENK